MRVNVCYGVDATSPIMCKLWLHKNKKEQKIGKNRIYPLNHTYMYMYMIVARFTPIDGSDSYWYIYLYDELTAGQ